MRRLVLISLLLGCSRLAVAEDAPRQVIDQAIQAAGGAEAIGRHQASTWSEKGTYHGGGTPLPYQGQYAIQYPDKFRMEIEGIFTLVLNGDQGWVQQAGETVAMTKEQLTQQQESHYVGWVCSLLPLRDKKFQLAPLESIKVDGKEARGVLVTQEGHRDVKLYFDAESSLLVQADTMAVNQETGGQEVPQRTLFKNYQKHGGALVPTQVEVTQDGKPFVEAQMFDIQTGPPAAGSFDKPK